jgi:plasmid stability protein
MAELILRGVEPEVIFKLAQRAEKHHRSVEEEHRAILRDTLLSATPAHGAGSFEQYLREMPEVGEDADFARINGAIREAHLAD